MPCEKLLCNQTIALLSMAALLLSSCVETKSVIHYAYAPLTANAPFLKEKNELQFTTHVMTGGKSEDADKGSIIGTNTKAAYALSKHIGVMASYGTLKEKETYYFDPENTILNHRRKFAEAGIGYFIAADRREKLYFDIYTGYGLGKNNIYYTGYNSFYRNNVRRFFIQSGISLHIKSNFRLTWLMRYSLISFRNVETNFPEETLRYSDVGLYRLDKGTYTTLEPAFAVQFPVSKLQWLRGYFQAGGSILLNTTRINNRGALAGIGITVAPSVALKKK